MESQRLAEIVGILCEIGELSALDPDQDFYEAGVSSVQSLPLLMQLEDRYSVSIPDDRFPELRTPRQICSFINELTGPQAPSR
jgi:acyl carrier protein